MVNWHGTRGHGPFELKVLPESYLALSKAKIRHADTWEQMENLVCWAQQIREYEKLREKEDIEAKAAVLAKRQEAKNAAAAVEEDLKAHAAEEALAGAGEWSCCGTAPSTQFF
jgi:hypothetical protein